MLTYPNPQDRGFYLGGYMKNFGKVTSPLTDLRHLVRNAK